MGHNLDFQKGDAAFFTVKEVAWHNLGRVVEEAPNSEEAIILAGLDYEVKLTEVYAKLESLDPNENRPYNWITMQQTSPSPNGILTAVHRIKSVKNTFATYRDDTKHIFGAVGGRYEVVQNAKAFSFFDDIIGSKQAIFETAGAINDGATIFITAKLPDYIRVNGDDVINKYLLFTSSHDGSGAIRAMFTPIRVVCNNTLSMALEGKGGVSIKHTMNVHAKIDAAANLLGIVSRQTEEIQELLQEIATIKISQTMFEDYLNYTFLSKEEYKLLLSGEDMVNVVSTNKINIINEIKAYYETVVVNEFSHCAGTLYGAYNAITGYLQNVKKYSDDTKKFNSLFLNDKVGVKALQNAKVYMAIVKGNR